ncbi:hypothetical protein Hanom_Chr11g00982551 [Helianthus anomalus]
MNQGEHHNSPIIKDKKLLLLMKMVDPRPLWLGSPSPTNRLSLCAGCSRRNYQ